MLCALTRTSSGDGFTLVELMIVVVIVAILSLVLVPLQSSRIKAARMTEGISGVGMIRQALRVHAAGNSGRYPELSGVDGSGLTMLGIQSDDLAGRYFSSGSYRVQSTATTYAIRATLPEDADVWFEVDQDGDETRHSF